MENHNKQLSYKLKFVAQLVVKIAGKKKSTRKFSDVALFHNDLRFRILHLLSPLPKIQTHYYLVLELLQIAVVSTPYRLGTEGVASIWYILIRFDFVILFVVLLIFPLTIILYFHDKLTLNASTRPRQSGNKVLLTVECKRVNGLISARKFT